MRFLFVFVLITIHSISYSAETQQDSQDVKHWKGEAELGLLTTRGNTDTETLNAKAAFQYQKNDWTHILRLEALRAEDRDTTTADRARYQVIENGYLFGSVRYESDPFAGYDTRTTEVAGYGHQVINRETLKWDVEAGAGARQTDNTDSTDTSEAIARLATNLEWRFTDTSSFRQEIFVEHGSENTLTEATTDLKVKINSALAMKLTLTVKDNSEVPAGKKHTDTQTAVTLVYDFFK